MKPSRINEIKLIFSIALALLVFISLLTFDRDDIRFLTSSPNISRSNVTGFVGAYLAYAILFLMGFGAYIIPVFIVLWGAMSFFEEKDRKTGFRVFGAVFSVLAISSVFSIIGSQDLVFRFRRGGIIGLVFSDFLLKYLGTVGALIIIAVLFLLAIIITTDFLIFPFIAWLPRALRSFIRNARSAIFGKIKIRRPARAPEKKAPVPEAPPKILEPKAKIREKPKKDASPKPAPKKAPAPQKPFESPSVELLTAPPPMEEREIKEDLEENSRILEDTLRDFGIEAKVVNVSKGPVITRYELEPASGVKVHRITSLSDDIALAMKSVSARVIAPIPGKGAVGIEVPNLKSTFVYLRELLESKEYKTSPSKLRLALGKDISGKPIIADLDEMPHLLIAGTTGSGKTVCVNSIIATLLFNTTPDELKLLMVDPKKVELIPFNDLPHLLAPVVTEPKKVSHALDWIVDEMERRFDLFTQVGVKNISVYNERVKKEKLTPIPYIVIVIDELHNLMLVAKQEVENTITRLAALSRAVGIHMIIATQRPSVNVITGVIKANLPARISFKVASKVDSRTVLDMNGAEKLLGKGDMLFLEPGNPKPIRAQGSLVSDGDINKLASFIRSQRKPDFEEGILRVEEKSHYKKFEKDEIYQEAVRLVIQTRQASVSMLQRRLGVGYTRAARLIDMMEDAGVVGPYRGSKPREILVENTEDKR